MKRTRINMLGKFIISYLLVLSLPVGFILLYYYPHSTRVVNEKEMAWNAHVTEQFKNAMDVFTRYVYNLPFELTQNREIRLYMAEEDDYQRYVIASEMRKYNATDAFIYNTLLYVKNIGYLFAKTGSAYTVADFARPGVGYYYEDWPHDRMFEQLDHLTEPIVRPVESVIVPGKNRIRMLTFALPLPLGGSHSPGVVMIMVQEQSIIGMMRSVAELYAGDFFIFDEQGNRLVASGRTEDADAAALKDILARLNKQKSGSAIERLGDKSYVVSYTVSDKNGWQFVSLLPITAVQKDIRAVQRNTAIWVGALLLLELIVIYVSIRKNYQPIKRLVDFAANIFAASEPRKLGEIETIRLALDRLSADNSKLGERVKTTLPIMRDNVLFDLVCGRYHAWEDLHEAPGAQGLSFDYPCVTVAVLTGNAGDESQSGILAICRAQEVDAPEGLRVYFFKSIYHDEIVAVCAHLPTFPLQPYLDRLQRMLRQQTGAQVRIGIGKTESPCTPESVQLSYLTAMRTAEHLQIRHPGPTLVFDEIEMPQGGAISYSAELLQSLELSILKNDVPAIEAVLTRLIDDIRHEGMPPHLVRAIYLNTISVIMSGFQRFRHDDRHLLALSDAALHHRYTIEQMAGILRESGAKLCALISDTLPLARTASIEEVLAFIEANGMHPNFSQQMVAERFGMSVSNFSYFFKKSMGLNFKEYIDRLRIQHSARLLRETDQTLETIAQQIGYANTSSFIRCFKKVVGMTPGQYREVPD